MIKISRWEDLIGLENGKGLRIEKRTNALSEVLYGEECIKRLDKTIKLSITVNKLKAMGFELEWNPKMTEDEILSKYDPRKFIKHVCDYYVRLDGQRYVIAKDIDYPKFGYCYYNEETAKKVCEELNE